MLILTIRGFYKEKFFPFYNYYIYKFCVRLEDGVILDEKAFCNDFVNLAQGMGVFLYEDLLCIMSLRYQTIHILQIWDSGNLVDVRNVGIFCREDDELFINSHAQVSNFLTQKKKKSFPSLMRV